MSAAFVRRFLVDPGDDVLLEIESINVLDLEPPADIVGAGAGTVCLVGEFEKGPFNEPTEVTSAGDMQSTFGGLGYVYAGDVANNPSARSRVADGALVAEPWNGNAVIHLNGKKFKRLILVRSDTSVGSVTFTRLASLLGLFKPTYKLAPGQTLVFSEDGAGDVTATFNATVAQVTGAMQNFAAIAAGDTVTLGYDGAPDFVTTFLTGDTTIAKVFARINQYAGFAFGADNGMGQLQLTGLQKGTGAQVRVVSASAGVLTKLGLMAGTTNGTGNVADILHITQAELNTVVNTAHNTVFVEKLDDGTPRMFTTNTPGTGTLRVQATSTALDFGFPLGVTDLAATGLAGTIPAGTRVRKNAGAQLVTMEDIAVTATSAGPYTSKVRHALDDGTGLATGAGQVVIVEAPILLDAFTVINPLPTTVAKTEPQIDNAYDTALDATLDVNTVSKEINIIFSARQSNDVRRHLRQNALDASANGLQGRVAPIRPPLGTTRAVAEGNAEPGVGAYRDQRVPYCYPGLRSKVPAIAQKGTSGGFGFTADGVVDQGSDGWLASVMSQLAPEEDPGQQTDFMNNVLALESSPNVKGFTITDYTNFKSKGICAPRFDSGAAFFQSGVTSVDPAVHPSLADINRRRMADFLQDSLTARLTAFSKLLNGAAKRTAITQEVRQFMRGMLGGTNAKQRIAGFTLKNGIDAGNTAQRLGKGMFRLLLLARTLSSLKSIVLAVTAGSSVTVEELAPGEAA